MKDWLNELGRLCKLQKGCIRLAAASNKAYQLHAHGRWFSPGTPASSTTKTGRHDIAKILLKVALKHQKNQIVIYLLKLIFCFTEYVTYHINSNVQPEAFSKTLNFHTFQVYTGNYK